MFLVVGLGNPGQEYKNTPHNAGFEAVSALADALPDFSDWKMNKKFNAEISEGKIGREKIVLARPQTFMNNSGEAVAKIANFYKISPENIIVIHDDIDMPVEKIRIKIEGTSGGHRGIESIIKHLGSQDFIRLKIGVGPAERGDHFDAATFVLKKLSRGEGKDLSTIIDKTTRAIITILREGPNTAMNQFNCV